MPHGYLPATVIGKLAEKLAEVADLGHGAGRPLWPVLPLLPVMLEQFGVLLHGRTAARRVDHDDLDARVLERGDGPLGEHGGLGGPAGVQREGAAAALAGRDDHVAALRREHPRRRGVDFGEEYLLDAAGEHADDSAPRPVRRTVLGRRRMAGG